MIPRVVIAIFEALESGLAFDRIRRFQGSSKQGFSERIEPRLYLITFYNIDRHSSTTVTGSVPNVCVDYSHSVPIYSDQNILFQLPLLSL